MIKNTPGFCRKTMKLLKIPLLCCIPEQKVL